MTGDPASGAGDGGRIPAFLNADAGSARSAADALAADPRFAVRSLNAPEMADAVRAEVARGTPRVLVAGGDGTLAAAAAAVLESGTALALLPAGTLNHFARAHGVPLDPAEALRLAVEGGARAVDVGTVDGHVFLNTSSVGAYVGYVRLRERVKGRLPRRLASLVAGVAKFARLRTFRVELAVEGVATVWATPLVFVGVGERELRFPSFGLPMEDGRAGLHVIAFQGAARMRLLAMAVRAAAGGVERLESGGRARSYLVERCTIRMPKPVGWLSVDGEIVRMPSPLEYRLARGALRVVLPPE